MTAKPSMPDFKFNQDRGYTLIRGEDLLPEHKMHAYRDPEERWFDWTQAIRQIDKRVHIPKIPNWCQPGCWFVVEVLSNEWGEICP